MNRRKLMGWLLCGLLAPVRLFKGLGRSEVSEQVKVPQMPLRDEQGRFTCVFKGEPVYWGYYTGPYGIDFWLEKDE